MNRFEVIVRKIPRGDEVRFWECNELQMLICKINKTSLKKGPDLKL